MRAAAREKKKKWSTTTINTRLNIYNLIPFPFYIFMSCMRAKIHVYSIYIMYVILIYYIIGIELCSFCIQNASRMDMYICIYVLYTSEYGAEQR